MRAHYYVIEQPTSEQWQRILDWALARGQRIAWLYSDVRGPMPKILRPFAPLLVEAFTTCHYWGDRQLRAVRVFQFRIDESLRDFLLSRPDLLAWCGPPPALSDPMVFDQGDDPLLWTIAHESLVFLWMDEAEVSDWERTYGMSLMLAEDVEPPIVTKDVPCEGHLKGDTLIMAVGVAILLAFLGMAYFMAEGFIRLLGQ